MNYSKNLGVALDSIFGNNERMHHLLNTKHWHLDVEVLTFICMDGGHDLTEDDISALLSIVRVFVREQQWAQCGE